MKGFKYTSWNLSLNLVILHWVFSVLCWKRMLDHSSNTSSLQSIDQQWLPISRENTEINKIATSISSSCHHNCAKYTTAGIKVAPKKRLILVLTHLGADEVDEIDQCTRTNPAPDASQSRGNRSGASQPLETKFVECICENSKNLLLNRQKVGFV